MFEAVIAFADGRTTTISVFARNSTISQSIEGSLLTVALAIDAEATGALTRTISVGTCTRTPAGWTKSTASATFVVESACGAMVKLTVPHRLVAFCAPRTTLLLGVCDEAVVAGAYHRRGAPRATQMVALSRSEEMNCIAVMDATSVCDGVQKLAWKNTERAARNACECVSEHL